MATLESTIESLCGKVGVKGFKFHQQLTFDCLIKQTNKKKKKKKKKKNKQKNKNICVGIHSCLNEFVCVVVLRPSQPIGVMSSAVSLPNHTFTGQA